jgi:hypothetical protein
VSEEQQMPEYKQGDNVRLTVELRDQNGVEQVDTWVIVAENAYHAVSRHELNPPLCLRIVEDPDDVRQGPEILSVGTFW